MGYEYEDGDIYPVTWEDYQTHCEPCNGLVSAYNDLMHAMFALRYEVAYIRNVIRDFDSGTEYLGQKTSDGSKGLEGDKGSLYVSPEEIAAGNLNYKMAIETLRNETLPALLQKISEIRSITNSLRSQIADCEKGCSAKTEGTTGIQGESDSKWRPSLPFAWAGPYPEVCYKCAKLAERLNLLPKLATEIIAKLEANAAQQMAIRVEMEQIRLFNDAITYYTPQHVNSPENMNQITEKRMERSRKKLEKLEEQLRETENKAEILQRDLDTITANFNQTLHLYNKCVPTCEAQSNVLHENKQDMHVASIGETQPPLKQDMGGTRTCTSGVPLQQVITLGPNSEYGTGAQMQDKAVDTVKGMAMGAVSGLLGGNRGVSFGGGGSRRTGSSGNNGPKTEDDPTSGDYIRGSLGEIELGMRCMAQGTNQFLVSAKIFDAPGDGTFHTMWLSDAAGNIVLPKRYYIFDVYQDWKLTVWWTEDRWVNGEHVYHDEGKEITTGRNDLGASLPGTMASKV